MIDRHHTAELLPRATDERVGRAGTGRAGRGADARATWLNVYRIYRAALPDRELEALFLVEVEGRTYAAAARILTISHQTVAQLVLQARRRILTGMQPTLRELANRAG